MKKEARFFPLYRWKARVLGVMCIVCFSRMLPAIYTSLHTENSSQSWKGSRRWSELCCWHSNASIGVLCPRQQATHKKGSDCTAASPLFGDVENESLRRHLRVCRHIREQLILTRLLHKKAMDKHPIPALEGSTEDAGSSPVCPCSETL